MKGDRTDLVHQTLLNILDKDGVPQFLSVAKAMLSVDAGRVPSMKAQFVGQVCETVLYGLTREYIKLRCVKASCYPSVVLKNLKDMGSDFRTELDFIICSPYFILTTECKSYAGAITVRGKGEFRHRGHKADVYRQSVLHHRHLYTYAEQLVKPKLGLSKLPVFANAFVFSNSTVSDERTGADASAMSILTVSSLFGYYDQMFSKFGKEVFDYPKACRVFGACSKSVELHRQHKAYIGY